MPEQHEATEIESPVVAKRWAELLVALGLMALASLVMADSLRVGTGWSEDGPRSGYFPFYIGLALFGSGLWIAAQQLRRWCDIEALARRDQLRSVLAVLMPMAIYVAAIPWLSIYLASALLIGGFMWRHGEHAHWACVAVPLGVLAALYITFERWFLVPLPKGWLGTVLGL